MPLAASLRRLDEQWADWMLVADLAIETTRLVDEIVSGADAVFHLVANVGEIDGPDRTRASHWSSRAPRDAARFRRRDAPIAARTGNLGAGDLTTGVAHGCEVDLGGAVWGLGSTQGGGPDPCFVIATSFRSKASCLASKGQRRG
jgi:hypothetical protein